MAVLSSFAYARTRVRQAKTGQRVRLAAVVSAQVGGVFNATHRAQPYARTSQRSGAPWFAWSNTAIPLPFEHDTMVPAPGCTAARFAWTVQRNLILTCDNGGTLEERLSTDDGLSWSSASSGATGIAFPDVTASRDGLLIRAWAEGTELHLSRQYPGDPTASSDFIAENDASAALELAATDFRLVYDARGFLWLHYLPDGATDTLLAFSADDGESFQTSSGSVTGVANGTHAGLCAGVAGDLWAYAYVAGEVHLSRRAPGDANWSTPTAIEDENGDPVLVEDQAFSMAEAFEGSRRLVLACLIDGESVASEHASADDGLSFIRL